MIETAVDILDMHGCVIRDENGNALANLYEEGGLVIVKKTTACSIGMYFYILRYLGELGFVVR